MPNTYATISDKLNLATVFTPDKNLVHTVDDILAEHPGWYRSERAGILAPDGSRWKLCMRDGLFRLTSWTACKNTTAEQIAEAGRRC